MSFEFILFILLALFGAWIAYKIGNYVGARIKEGEIDTQRQDAIKRSRAVLTGHFSEQLAPLLPDFPFSPTECRFIGKPIDLMVFVGSDNREIEEIVFVEVKTGSSQLSPVERSLRDTIQNKKVRWVEYRR